jgi:MHS family alpha-ketoglutarate permease-like MFS transporter
MALGAVPLLSLLAESGHSPAGAFALVGSALLILSFYTSVSGLFKAELFPAHIRALGVGFAHSLAAALFGGTAEWVALMCKQQGVESAFYWYVAGSAAVAFVVALLMPEPSREGRL